MSLSLFLWIGLTILSWGLFGFAAKCSARSFNKISHSPYNSLLYQPIGYILGGALWGLYSTNFQLETDPLGILWAFLTGLFLGLGLIFFIKALVTQTVSLISPLTALYPIITLFLAVFIIRETIAALQIIAIALAFLAIWLLNGGTLRRTKLASNRQAAFSKTVVKLRQAQWFRYALATMFFWGFFAFFPRLALDHIATPSAIVYQAMGYLMGSTLPGLFLIGFKPQANAAGIGFGILAGIGSGAGGIFYMHGLLVGSVAIVAPATSLYPVITIALAHLFIRERLPKSQKWGVGLSLVSILLIHV
ncbi:MAG: EamA family transporter [Chloroflexota bacterium]